MTTLKLFSASTFVKHDWLDAFPANAVCFQCDFLKDWKNEGNGETICNNCYVKKSGICFRIVRLLDGFKYIHNQDSIRMAPPMLESLYIRIVHNTSEVLL